MFRNDKRILRKSINSIKKNKKLSENDKEKQIKTVEKLIKEKDIKTRYSLLYDEICNYLDYDFVIKNVCGFKDNLCSRRQSMIEKNIKKDTYLNGCCHSYKEGKDCEHLKNGRCSIKNIACKLYTCPYLRKKGKNYSINKISFAKHFFNLRQKFYIQNTYFVDKDVVLKGILKRM